MGVWIPQTDILDRVVHIWPYRDFDYRTEVRAGVNPESEWAAYLRLVVPWIREIRSTVWRCLPPISR